MTTGDEQGAGADGVPATAGSTPEPLWGSESERRRSERSRRRREAARRRAAWAGGRWWAPGLVAAVGAAAAGALGTLAWRAYEDGGCGSGGDFACLFETFAATAAVALLGPVLLWSAYRGLGVARPVLSTLVAVLLLRALAALPVLAVQLRLLLGWETPPVATGPLWVAVVLGLAALGGGLALQGPRRAVRALAAGAVLVALAVTVPLLTAPAETAGLRTELAGARVPLLLPGPGWQVDDVFVAPDGDLHYDVVPAGGTGRDGVPVVVEGDRTSWGDECSRGCTWVGDVAVLPSDQPGPETVRRAVDGAFVTVGRYSRDSWYLDRVEVARQLAPVTVDALLARRVVRPG